MQPHCKTGLPRGRTNNVKGFPQFGGKEYLCPATIKMTPDMKRFLLLALFITTATLLRAQSEVKGDSIATPPASEGASSLLPSTVRNYGGFLLDMGTVNLPHRPSLDNFKLEIPDASKDYSFIFRPRTDAVYTQGNYTMGLPYTGFGRSSFWGTSSTLQMGSFQLNNGWKLNTYGEYDADGRRVYNPSALPWERNNFKGAFELKSENGFGLRIEVQQGKDRPFP